MINDELTLVRATAVTMVEDSQGCFYRFREEDGSRFLTTIRHSKIELGVEYALIGIRRPNDCFATSVAFMLDQTVTSTEDDLRLADAFRVMKEAEISDHVIAKVFKAYGKRTRTALDDPYRMYIESRILSLQECGRLCRKLQLHSDGVYRQAAQAIEILRKAAGEGKCYLHVDTLRKRLGAKQSVEHDEALRFLIDEGYVVRDDYRIYLTTLYEAECFVAEDLSKRLASGYGCFEYVARSDDEQEHAISNGCEHAVSIVTGGPGTGKTTATQKLIHCHTWEAIGLYAPTGKAAQRLKQQTGFDAMTMHMAVSQCRETGEMISGLVVIDEMSMVDIRLLADFLQCVSSQAKIVFVGDAEQLPSIGPGAVLRDLTDSGVIPTTELTKVHRQEEASGIVKTSCMISAGRHDVYEDETFRYVDKPVSEDECSEAALQLYLRLRECNGVTAKDVVILTPYAAKGAASSRNLNKIISEKLSCGRPGVDLDGSHEVRCGDRVVHTKNDYTLNYQHAVRNVADSDFWAPDSVRENGEGVFNGETGTVISADSTTIAVDFDNGKSVVYTPAEYGELDLSYAMTIHKSQGSEYEYVIVVLPDRGDHFVTRKLLYTAVTRAKKKCFIISQGRAYQYAVNNTNGDARNSQLARRLQKPSR